MFSLRNWLVRPLPSRLLDFFENIRTTIRHARLYPETRKELEKARDKLATERRIIAELRRTVTELESQVGELERKTGGEFENLRTRILYVLAVASWLERSSAISELIGWLETHVNLPNVEIEFCAASPQERRTAPKFEPIRKRVEQLRAEIQVKKEGGVRKKEQRATRSRGLGTNPEPLTT